MKFVLIRWLVAGSALLLIGVIGCQDSPVAPTSTVDQTITPVVATTLDDPIKLCARIQTADYNRRMLTLGGCPDTVVAYQNCQITRFKEGGEAPIPFDSLAPGDSVDITGERNMDGYVYAYKITVLAKKAYGNFDVAFRDTLATVDYAAGSFTVLHHPETIVVDESTLIWNVVKQWSGGEGGNKGTEPSGSFGGGDEERPEHLVYYALTDLQPGDVIELRANRIDETTLLAVYVKVAECDPVARCERFESTIASLDLDTRILTFADSPWISWVCPKAKLLDADGLPLTLADFAVGEAVSVKGVPLAGDTLRVCEMTKLPVL